MKKIKYILAILTIAMTISSCKDNTVTIGNQKWASSNLEVTTYSNGDPIMESLNEEDWKKYRNEGIGCYRVYKNTGMEGSKNILYNTYAISDKRGLSPKGWHIPTDDEWQTLIKYSGQANASLKIKSTNGWLENGNGNNELGFNAHPTGIVNYPGNSQGYGKGAAFWSDKGYGGYYIREDISTFNNGGWGASVRLIRD